MLPLVCGIERTGLMNKAVAAPKGDDGNKLHNPPLAMKRRLNFVVRTAFLLAFCILVGSLVNISVVNYGFYSEKAENMQMRPETISPTRGSIYDRNMTVLAQSATVWDVIISPKDIITKAKNSTDNAIDEEKIAKRQKQIAEALCGVLGTDYDSVFEKMQKTNSQYQVISRKVDKIVADEIRLLITENGWTNEINLTETSKRFYTNGTRASQLIGFVGSDSQGLYGLEYYYDDELSGTPGYVTSLKNAHSENIPMSYEEKFDPIDGNSLVLTLDDTIQRYLNKTLNQVMVQHDPKNGCAGIVMNVNTGEILAMESLPSFDLNQPYYIYSDEVREEVEAIEDEDEKNNAKFAAQQGQWFNKAISYDYEPGSTFKTLVTAAAIEEKTTTQNSSFYCNGFIEVEDRKMNCHVGIPGHGAENFVDALVNSCNPAYVKIGADLGANKFFKYFEGFGLTEKTGVDLPGEGQGAYYSEKSLAASKVSLASCSFGQSTTVTALQMVTAVSAAVNGGYLVTPHVVKDVLNSSGNIVRSVGTQVKRQVVSEETSETLRSMMQAVVETKPGSNAYVQGYAIGGKSGTSQKQKASDSEDDRIASYVAVAPIDNPEIAVYIMVDVPQSGDFYGSVIAAPAAASVLSDTLSYLGYSPSFTQEEMEAQDLTVPFLLEKGVLEAEGILSANGFAKPTVIGEGTVIKKQVPSAGSKLARDGVMILYTDANAEEELIEVPNVVGMKPTEAKAKLEKLGFNVVINGADYNNSRSKVSLQNMQEGEMAAIGSVIEITSVTSEGD